MPLLISPIDGSPMRQINRFGIELDVCPTSGGVWLDRGELEKLMALMKQAAEEEARMMSAPMPGDPYSQVPNQQAYEATRHDPYATRQPDPRHYPPQHSGHDPYYQDKHGGYRKPHKPKTGLQRMMDIFDFD